MAQKRLMQKRMTLTRRHFLWVPIAATGAAAGSTPAHLAVPVHRIMDSRARCTPEQLNHFWHSIWPEAVRDFAHGGIALETTDGPGEVKRSPADIPVFIGLRRGVINLVLTDHIPMKWDSGRSSAGVTTIWAGYHLCLIALAEAQADQVPWTSVNTVVHELLHALLQDVYVTQPTWYQSGSREFRIDWYATQMSLLHNAAAIRQSAQSYLARLRDQ